MIIYIERYIFGAILKNIINHKTLRIIGFYRFLSLLLLFCILYFDQRLYPRLMIETLTADISQCMIHIKSLIYYQLDRIYIFFIKESCIFH